ncbi:hypothetical protein ABZX90_21720 [Streptomyces sp. NPDC002935]|uniref:hypothetical protein n=1 Tax=unclassified Streptomyces TaxID=2593676 RepID=UPI00332E0A8F
MAHGEDSAPNSRARVWIGLLAVVVGSCLAGDAVHRARAALEFGARWWPWALLSLAVVNLLRAALPTGSLIGPVLLAAVASAGLVRSGDVGSHALADLALPGVLALGGAALVLAASRAGRRSSWSRVLATGQVVAPEGTRGTVTVRAVLGELRADLTRATADSGTTVHVTAIVGHVVVAVPRDRRVRVHTSGAVLTRIAETGAQQVEPSDPSTGFTVHVLGICGAVGIVRV